MNFQSTTEEKNTKPGRDLLVIGGLFVLVMILALGFMLGGEVGQFMLAGAQTIPFVILAMLAYLGSERRWARAAAILWLFIVILVYVLFNLSLTLIAVEGSERSTQTVVLVLLGIALAVLISLFAFIPAVRRLFSRVIPIRSDSFVHTIALVSVLAFTLIGFVPLLVDGAPPLLSQNILEMLELDGGAESDASMRRFEAYGLLWTTAGAVFTVGFGIRRSFSEAWKRLGVVRPTLKQVIGGVVLAAALVFLVQYFGSGIQRLWEVMGWPVTDEEAFSELLGFALTPVGAVLTSLSAGIGEELAIRGALQPRMGILLPTLFFTSLHAMQYNWDSLLIVFMLGLVMAVVRARANTTTSIIVHTLYDFGVILLAMLFPDM